MTTRAIRAALMGVVVSVSLTAGPASAFTTIGEGKWQDNRYLWTYNPAGEQTPAGARAANVAIETAARTWQDDRGSVIEMRRLADVGVLRVIESGPDGIANTTAAAGDFQVIPPGQGRPYSICIIAAGAALDPATVVGGDDKPDTADGVLSVTSGPDGICNSTAGGADLPVIGINRGAPNAITVVAGAANGVLATAAAGDDTPRLTRTADDNCRVNNDLLNVVAWGRNPSVKGGAKEWLAPVVPDDPLAHGVDTTGTLAQAFTSARLGTELLQEADICINQFVPFHTGPGNPPATQSDLEFNVLHEFGHAIGLHHSNLDAPRARQQYEATVMYEDTRRGQRLPALFCDDKSGANFMYPPLPPAVVVPANDVTEARLYGADKQGKGGCDYGDAPDPLRGVVGRYPSREVDPAQRALLHRFKTRTLNPDDPDAVTVTPQNPGGARHKDTRMEWLGPMSVAQAAQPALPLKPKEPGLTAEPAAVAGSDGFRTPNRATSVTFEPDSLQPNLDERDDGVSFVPTGFGRFDVYVFVNTSGVANRYVARDANRRLYLNGWSDWNCNGQFENPKIPAPPAGTPAGELMLWWAGTPDTDDAFSPNFDPPGTAIGQGRLLRFRVEAPAGKFFGCWQRYRLDYGEDVGRIQQPWTDPSLVDAGPNDAQGEATYGEVEDTIYRRDHFQCFELHRAPLNRAGVSLADQFGASTVTVKRAKRLCAPANKNGEDPTAATDNPHLTAYTLTQTDPRFEPIRDVKVTNQFGSLTVELVRPERLLVPTAKNLFGTPAELDEPFDHYKCYRVRGAKFHRAGITVETQFGMTKVDIKRPHELCVPANKNNEGIIDPVTHLMCYVALAPRPAAPKKVFTRNQFEPAEYPLFGGRELCVPSRKEVPTPTPTPTPTP